MKNFYDNHKAWIIPVALILLLTTASFFAIKYFINPPKSIEHEAINEIEVARDSIRVLLRKNEELEVDAVVTKGKLIVAEWKVAELENKKAVIKEVYREKIKYVDRYTPSDITVYFNNRYGSDSVSVKQK